MLHSPRPKLSLDLKLLSSLIDTCDKFKDKGIIMKCAMLFAYFGFLRRSNLAPDTCKSFDPKRHTCRGDIVMNSSKIVIILKWTKTYQKGTTSI